MHVFHGFCSIYFVLSAPVRRVNNEGVVVGANTQMQDVGSCYQRSSSISYVIWMPIGRHLGGVATCSMYDNTAQQ
jgi:hypothetical protein